MQLNPYLTFNGNCREAMAFYKKCLGGKLMLQTVDGSPMAEKLPDAMKKYILHATLTTKGFVIMGSDMTPEIGFLKGNASALMLNCSSGKEINGIFNKLSKGGKVNHPLKANYWGALFGDFSDRFGNHWILNFDKTNKN